MHPSVIRESAHGDADTLSLPSPRGVSRFSPMLEPIRGGRDNDPGFFTRMKGQGIWPQLIRQRVRRAAREHGMDRRFPPLRCDLFRPPERDGQMELF